METNNILFVGFELTDLINEQFSNCQDRNRAYIEDSLYLETVTIDGTTYVGKKVEGAVAIDRIEDTARSVVSLLVRVCSNWPLSPDQALVIAAEKEAAASITPLSMGVLKNDDSELVD